MMGHGYGPGGSGGDLRKICLKMSKNGSRRRGYKKEKRLISAVIVYVAIVVMMMKLKLQILGLIYGELIMSLRKGLFGKSEKGYHLIQTIHFGRSVWWKNNSFSKKYSYVYIAFQNINHNYPQ